MVVVDSDIIIDFLNNIEYAVNTFKSIQENGDELFTTSINSFELFKGFHKYSEEKINRLSDFFKIVRILDFNFNSSRKAAEIFKYLKSKGELIDLADIMIGSIAIANNQKLITRNIKHFNRIPNLEIEKV